MAPRGTEIPAELAHSTIALVEAGIGVYHLVSIARGLP